MKVAQAVKGVARLLLDSAPVIYHAQGHSGHQQVLDFIFRQAVARNLRLVTTPITLAECLTKPMSQGNAQLIKDFQDFITVQLAAAVQHGCDALLTNDRAFKKVIGIPILILDDLEP